MKSSNGTALAVVVCTLALAACSSGGNKLEHGEPALTLEEIVGVWDMSADVKENGVTAYDEAYIVISEYGVYSEYDYLGDKSATDPRTAMSEQPTASLTL